MNVLPDDLISELAFFVDIPTFHRLRKINRNAFSRLKVDWDRKLLRQSRSIGRKLVIERALVGPEWYAARPSGGTIYIFRQRSQMVADALYYERRWSFDRTELSIYCYLRSNGEVICRINFCCRDVYHYYESDSAGKSVLSFRQLENAPWAGLLALIRSGY